MREGEEESKEKVHLRGRVLQSWEIKSGNQDLPKTKFSK